MTEDVVWSNLIAADPDLNRYLTLMPCGIRIDMKTGEVEIPDGLSLSAASYEIWHGLKGALSR